MPLVPLSDDFLDELENPPEKIRKQINTTCSKCSWHLDQNGYCSNVECQVYQTEKQATFECEYCGHCTTPGKCIRSVTCPLCFRVPGHSCVSENNANVVVYHEQRWQEVKRVHGTYYK